MKDSLTEQIGQNEDAWVSLEMERRRIEADHRERLRQIDEKQQAAAIKRLRLRKQAGQLRDSEKELWSRELEAIEELERLEEEERSKTSEPASEKASEVAPGSPKPAEPLSLLDGVPFDWFGQDAPDWSLPELLHVGDTPEVVLGNS